MTAIHPWYSQSPGVMALVLKHCPGVAGSKGRNMGDIVLTANQICPHSFSITRIRAEEFVSESWNYDKRLKICAEIKTIWSWAPRASLWNIDRWQYGDVWVSLVSVGPVTSQKDWDDSDLMARDVWRGLERRGMGDRWWPVTAKGIGQWRGRDFNVMWMGATCYEHTVF